MGSMAQDSLKEMQTLEMCCFFFVYSLPFRFGIVFNLHLAIVVSGGAIDIRDIECV